VFYVGHIDYESLCHVVILSKHHHHQVQAAYRQMELSGKELESHKAKRLVARNEMIGAAQALERSQTEGQALRAFNTSVNIYDHEYINIYFYI
jgi:hypothetical protein